ncbi:hypothetical protein J6590_050440 [Homalodisca vitripennis]|nr:hypothetical protein J6590_050440 [Homalodisca vitripennis]
MPHNGPRQGHPFRCYVDVEDETGKRNTQKHTKHREVLPSRWPSAKLARPVDTEQTADNKINNETTISHPEMGAEKEISSMNINDSKRPQSKTCDFIRAHRFNSYRYYFPDSDLICLKAQLGKSQEVVWIKQPPLNVVETPGQKRMRKEAHKLDKIQGQEANVSVTKRKKYRQCTKNGKSNVKTAFHCVTCPEKPGLCMGYNMRQAEIGAELVTSMVKERQTKYHLDNHPGLSMKQVSDISSRALVTTFDSTGRHLDLQSCLSTMFTMTADPVHYLELAELSCQVHESYCYHFWFPLQTQCCTQAVNNTFRIRVKMCQSYSLLEQYDCLTTNGSKCGLTEP